MPILIIIAVGLWFAFGDPPETVANWFWKDKAAPWEEVDAYYFPNRTNITVHQERFGLDDVQACRNWAYALAGAHRDRSMSKGDYECGIGRIDGHDGLSVYRITVR